MLIFETDVKISKVSVATRLSYHDLFINLAVKK